MAGSRGGENTVLADEKLLDTVGSTNLGDELDDLGVPEATITTNNKEGIYLGPNVRDCFESVGGKPGDFPSYP